MLPTNRFFAVFMIAACCMCLAFVIFVMGSPRYARKPPGGNSLMGLCYYIYGSAKQSKKGLISLTGWIVLLAFLVLSVVQAFVTDVSIKHALSWVALALAFYSCAVLCICHMRNDHLNGLEDHPAGLLSVAEARDMLDTVPIIIVINCGFMIVYKYVLVPRQARWGCSVPVLTLYLHCRALTLIFQSQLHERANAVTGLSNGCQSWLGTNQRCHL
jgi:hypothetical protein